MENQGINVQSKEKNVSSGLVAWVVYMAQDCRPKRCLTAAGSPEWCTGVLLCTVSLSAYSSGGVLEELSPFLVVASVIFHHYGPWGLICCRSAEL